jgi:hypothetical protein
VSSSHRNSSLTQSVGGLLLISHFQICVAKDYVSFEHHFFPLLAFSFWFGLGGVGAAAGMVEMSVRACVDGARPPGPFRGLGGDGVVYGTFKFFCVLYFDFLYLCVVGGNV